MGRAFMRGLAKRFWQLFKSRRSSIPETFSLGDRPPYGPPAAAEKKGELLSSNLETNLGRLRATFISPLNADLVVREFELALDRRPAALVFLDGLTGRDAINLSILQPLMYLAPPPAPVTDACGVIERSLLPGNQIKRIKHLDESVREILGGSSLLLVEGCAEAIAVETKGWEHRTMGKPQSEHVVRGPQEGFVETMRPNTAAIRRHLRCPELVTEMLSVGKRSRSDAAVMYVYDVADPKLVSEVKRRIKSVGERTDYVNDSGILEQLIEDHPRALVPQVIATERPDRCAAYLSEGRVVVLLGTSPYALVLPATFSMFIHTAEDYYLRWPYGTFVRCIRFTAGFIALLLPAFYVAVVNYHQEMIPTDLLLAIAASRENVPFPSIVEVLIMEASFELIREAGVRIPSVIGPTIGIVGALILGQAAVAASIVSPILIIVVAVTALSSFAIPNYNASFSLRVLRFVFIGLSSVLGFYGIAFGLAALAVHLVSLKSFGVPFMSPAAPYRPDGGDLIGRPPAYAQPYRPWFLRPLDAVRQRGRIRTWSPATPEETSRGKECEEKNE
ncbi:MAG: spore germination protein [Patescibacteria group bacterium]